MQINIDKKVSSKWSLKIGPQGKEVEYGSLYKLAKALMNYARGQKL